MYAGRRTCRWQRLLAIVAGGSFAALLLSPLATAQEKGDAVSQSQPSAAALADQLDKAMAAVRQGNYEPISELTERARELLPLLVRYANDSAVEVRREVVALLRAANSPGAVPVLVHMLADSDAEVQQAAAAGLYRLDPGALAKHPAAAKALAQSVAGGNTASAPSVLLLGYGPAASVLPALQKLHSQADQSPTKLEDWTPPVPVRLAAQVALSRLGDPQARRALLEATSQKDLAVRQFLLGVVRDIDSPEVLHALAAFLDDTRLTGSGAPSGAGSQRRLCDDAVNALVHRLKLKVGFALSDTQPYSAAQIDQVRARLSEAIPR